MTSKPRGKAAAAKDKAGTGVPKPVRVGLIGGRSGASGVAAALATPTAGGCPVCGMDALLVVQIASSWGDVPANGCI